MLNLVISNVNGLYCKVDTPDPSPPKCKKIKMDKELVTDSMSTIQTVVSSIQTRKMNAQQTTVTESTPPTKNTSMLDTQMVASQVSTITQLTKQVSILQLAHNGIYLKLNKLAKFIMAQLATNKTPSPSKHKAASGLCRSPGEAS